MNVKVLVATYMHLEAQEILSSKCEIFKCQSDEEGAEIARIEDVVAIVPGPTWRLSGTLFKSVSSLLVVARPGIGVDNVNIEAATEWGVAVVNTPDAPTVSTTE